MAQKKVHVFASDVIPFPGCPRSAGGNRSWQFISALKREGHNVTYSFPLKTYLADQITKEIGKNLKSDLIWCCKNHYNVDYLLETLKPDIAVFCNINMLGGLKKPKRDTILIADLYGPIHFEDFLMNNKTYLEEDCNQLIENFRKVDYVTTVSDRQKYFWAAYLSMAGFSLGELDPMVCPLSIEIPDIKRKPSSEMTVVFSGGFYPWQSPDSFLFAVADFLDSVNGGRLHIFGGPHKGLANAADVHTMLDRLQKNHPSVHYHGYRPVEELMEALSECWCALELMDRNIERELAITGRTVEFLGLGTPVIYNNYSTLSELIEKYNAGWTVSVDNTDQLQQVLQSIHDGGIQLIDKKSQGAVQLALHEFNAYTCIAPFIQLISSRLKKRATNTVSLKKELISHVKKTKRTLNLIRTYYQ